MKYGKRSSIPNWRKNELAMSSDQSDEKFYCKRNARNLSEKKRRDQFNVLILELCSMVSTSRTRKMDKSAVLKETINFLKQHNEMALRSEENAIQETWKPSFLSDDEFSQLMLEALDGFMIVFSQQGHILYTSDSIISLLRHLPKELKSSTIYELVHEDDRPEIFKILMEADAKKNEPELLKDKRYNFECRMRKGSLEPRETVNYESVRFNGSFSFFKNSEAKILDGSDQEEQCCFVATVRLQNTLLTREMTMSIEKEKEFASRHSLDWKFLFLDQRGPPVLGYLPFEVLGTSVYEYYHHDDLEKLTQCHEALMQTGEGTSCYYRYLTKGQEWIWLQTRYFITYNQWNSKPEFIVCTHRVVSYAELRKSFNSEVTFTDDSSLSTDFTNNWNANSRSMSEISLSLKSSSSESRNHSSIQYPIMSDKIYKSNATKSDTGSNSSSQLKYDAKRMPSVTMAPESTLRTESIVDGHPSQMGASLPSLASNQLSKNSDISDQMRVIQVKLQNQLVARHQRLQEDILRQQQELQNVQQQLLNAQQLMFQQSPIIGVSLDQNAKQDQSQRASSSKAANWNVEDVGQDQPATTEARSLNTQQSPLNVNQLPVYNQTRMSALSPQLTVPVTQSQQEQYQFYPMETNLQSSPSRSHAMNVPDANDRLAFPDIINAIRNPGTSSVARQGSQVQWMSFQQPPQVMADASQDQASSLLLRTTNPQAYNQQLVVGSNSNALDQDAGAFLASPMQEPFLELYDNMSVDPSIYLGSID